MRISAALEFSHQYSEAAVIFSGKRPDLSRASDEEMKEGYSEASVMANAAITLGMSRDKIILEEESLHTGQNVKNSLDLLLDRELRGILVVCSSYMARRVYYYSRKDLRKKNLLSSLNLFIFDADVAEDLSKTALTTEAQERKRQRILYEAKRYFCIGNKEICKP